MSTIWKWSVGHGFSEFDMPVGAKIIYVNSPNLDTCEFWAEVNATAPTEKRSFQFYGTGQPIPKGMRHVGTTVFPHQMSQIVWHLYECVKFA